MKKTACLLVLLGCVGAARAQVQVEVVMDQTQFVSKESVPVAVRIRNHSGETLRFGTNTWLTYLVEPQAGSSVDKTGDVPMAHDFTVETGKVATQRTDLAPFFDLARSGHYTVTATVDLADWGTEVSSTPVSFDVISGVKRWEQTFGVPASSPGGHGPPEVRKYILLSATYVKQTKLYLRLTDETESTVFRVQPLGNVTSFAELRNQLDGKNNLHLLYEESARTYGYRVITPNGDLIKHQQFYYADGPPHLRTDSDGEVYVADATRHVTAEDVPAEPVEEPFTNSVPPLKPPDGRH